MGIRAWEVEVTTKVGEILIKRINATSRTAACKIMAAWTKKNGIDPDIDEYRSVRPAAAASRSEKNKHRRERLAWENEKNDGERSEEEVEAMMEAFGMFGDKSASLVRAQRTGNYSQSDLDEEKWSNFYRDNPV